MLHRWTLVWHSLLHMVRGILRVRSSIRGWRHGLRRRGRGRTIDFNVSDRVPLNMVRIQAMARRWEEDCRVLIHLH
jgi:hypothetical protein